LDRILNNGLFDLRSFRFKKEHFDSINHLPDPTSQDDNNSDDQSFSTQGSNDTDDHPDDDSSDTPCDDDSADYVCVSQCSGNDN
jgi:hypothetical protein